MNSRDIAMQLKGLEDFRNDYVKATKEVDDERGLGIGGHYVIETIKVMDKRINGLVNQYKKLRKEEEYETIKQEKREIERQYDEIKGFLYG